MGDSYHQSIFQIAPSLLLPCLSFLLTTTYYIILRCWAYPTNIRTTSAAAQELMRPHYNRYLSFILVTSTFTYTAETTVPTSLSGTHYNYTYSAVRRQNAPFNSPTLSRLTSSRGCWIYIYMDRYSFLITPINRTIGFLASDSFPSSFFIDGQWDGHWWNPVELWWCSRNPIPSR